MKLIAQSIGVLMVSGAISLAIAPLLSLAQPAESFSLPDLPGIALTLEQKERLKQLDKQTQLELQAVLTPAQLMQLEVALESDGMSRTTIVALHLSPAQQTELMQLLQSPEQGTELLTPGQIETVRRNLPFHP